MTVRVQTGLENLIASPHSKLAGRRIGLLCNPASVDQFLNHARARLGQAYPDQITALFSPQHGFFAAKQDNMVESDDIIDPILGVPVFSLYGNTRVPTQEMFDLIDILLIDLQDAGARVYTFIYTMSYCLEAAARFDKQILVLDRPNPINGIHVEGNLLTPEQTSFVGRYPLPMRHGLTIGELALLFNQAHAIDCDLEVMPMQGWQRSMFFTDTGLPWVAPSPNLSTPTSALVYPGQVLWEGTNVSEGRGTTQPFELFGAPFVNSQQILAELDLDRLEGATLRPVIFEPTSNKWAGKSCEGFQIHVTNPGRFRAYDCGLYLLQQMIRFYAQDFTWKQPPYEYEYEKMPIDLIIGDADIRHRIEAQESIDTIIASWQPDLEKFKSMCRDFYLYT